MPLLKITIVSIDTISITNVPVMTLCQAQAGTGADLCDDEIIAPDGVPARGDHEHPARRLRVAAQLTLG